MEKHNISQISRCTLPETNSEFTPENRPKLPSKGNKQKYSNHPFSGAFAVSFQGSYIYIYIYFPYWNMGQMLDGITEVPAFHGMFDS